MDLMGFEEDEDDLEILDIINFGIPRRIYQRENHFEGMDATTFRKRFRLSKEVVRNLLLQIEYELEYPYDFNNSVSPINQLLTALRLFSTGGHLDGVADFSGMHTSTVSRIVVRVSEAIARLAPNYISMPNNIHKTQEDFYDIASFLKVIGAIDCSHFRIISPGGADAEIFRNRKNYFSINAQFICDANMKILNVVARWPGSSHDSTIFNNSIVRRDFENNRYRGCFLVGDSGYGSYRSYLMTPLPNPATQAEQLYNESRIRTRNVIERLFGVIKRRFPILAYGCRLKVDTFLTIIVATSVLHNIALEMNEEVPPLPEEVNEHDLNNEATDNDLLALTRLGLITEYFENLL